MIYRRTLCRRSDQYAGRSVGFLRRPEQVSRPRLSFGTLPQVGIAEPESEDKVGAATRWELAELVLA